MHRTLPDFRGLRPVFFGLALIAASSSGRFSQASDKLKEDEPEQVKATGTVTWLDLEGGFWGIQGGNHQQYDPLESLPKDFRKEGLKVRFEAIVEKDQVGVHQWGQIIKITKIDKVK